MYRGYAVGLIVAVAWGAAPTLAIEPAGPLFVGTETCVFEAMVSFDPPLGPDASVGTMAIAPGDGDCAAVGYICMDPSMPTDCLECPVDGIPTEGTPVCAGTYQRTIGDGAVSYAGDCRFATLDVGEGPPADAGALVAGAAFVVDIAFVGPNGEPGLKSVSGRLSPIDADPCGLAAALCTCQVLNLLYVPA